MQKTAPMAVVANALNLIVKSGVLEGIAKGCRLAGCALIGGETAEHPGCFMEVEYDLAGFTVGVVEADEVVDGRRIAPGDVLIGLRAASLNHLDIWLRRGLPSAPKPRILGADGAGVVVGLGNGRVLLVLDLKELLL